MAMKQDSGSFAACFLGTRKNAGNGTFLLPFAREEEEGDLLGFCPKLLNVGAGIAGDR